MNIMFLKKTIPFIVNLLLVTVILLITNVILYYFLYNVAFIALNWLNMLNFSIRLIIVLFGGAVLLFVSLALVQKVARFLSNHVFSRFHPTVFIRGLIIALAIINGCWNVTWIWKIPQQYNFWVLSEISMLSVFAFSLSLIVLPQTQSQTKEVEKSNYYDFYNS